MQIELAPDLLALAVFAAVTILLSIMVFSDITRKAKGKGSLGQY